jgi:coiled-coil-helix-coiled-coil-helix domain-containing protein 2
VEWWPHIKEWKIVENLQKKTNMARRQQSRPVNRAARSNQVPVRTAAPPAPVPVQPQQRQPGLMAQMASTAAGVAVGSSVGHVVGAGISSMFGGGSSQPQSVQEPIQQNQQPVAAQCEPDQKAFMKCLDAHPNDITPCQFYLDMYKQCQASQRPY